MQGELASRRSTPLGAGYDDVCDRASENLYDELAQGFAEIATADLKRINRALQRIDEKTYGSCEVCGANIPEARLRALPFAELCVDCKRAEEATGGPEPITYAPPVAFPSTDD